MAASVAWAIAAALTAPASAVRASARPFPLEFSASLWGASEVGRPVGLWRSSSRAPNPAFVPPSALAVATLPRGGESDHDFRVQVLRDAINEAIPEIADASTKDQWHAWSIAELGNLALRLISLQGDETERSFWDEPVASLMAVLALFSDEVVMDTFAIPKCGRAHDFENSPDLSGREGDREADTLLGNAEWQAEPIASSIVFLSCSGPEARAAAVVVLVSIADALSERTFAVVFEALRNLDEEALANTRVSVLEPYFPTGVGPEAARRALLALKQERRMLVGPKDFERFLKLSREAINFPQQSKRVRKHLFGRIVDCLVSRDSVPIPRAKVAGMLTGMLKHMDTRIEDILWWQAQYAAIRCHRDEIFDSSESLAWRKEESRKVNELCDKFRKQMHKLNSQAQ